jgi:DAK2 domain fusion protein YloV
VDPQFGTEQLVRWTELGSDLLAAARADIDALNVFPVPDGDTGTNMVLTWRAAAESLAGSSAQSLGEVAVAWSRGALLGARGNSGVITAQLMRGFAEVFDQSATADAGALLARALARAVELGYAGVARPVEGTILTVASAAARAAGDAARLESGAGAAAVLTAATEAAADALARTPEQLPVLARAGVVDAGGQGLVLLLEALRAVVDPTAPPADQVLETYGLGRQTSSGEALLASTGALHASTGALQAAVQIDAAEITAAAPVGPVDPISEPDGAFEVMYLLEAADPVVPRLRSELDRLGNSVVVVGGDGLWNVHVHTDDAGPAVEAGVMAGRVFRIRITPLTPAAPDMVLARLSTVARTVVAVATGAASAALFESVGARSVVAGPGARPSPAELVVAAGDATEVMLLPNDDDHLAAAEAAAVELRARSVQVAVVPTHADVQGLAALAVHDSSRPFTEDVVAMTSAAGATRHGAVTRAEREAITSAGICHPGQVLGVVEGDIVVIGAEPDEVACAVVDRMLAAGGELVTILLGADPFPGAPAAEAIRRHLHESRLDVEVIVYDGGQAHYPLLIGVE